MVHCTVTAITEILACLCTLMATVSSLQQGLCISNAQSILTIHKGEAEVGYRLKCWQGLIRE